MHINPKTSKKKYLTLKHSQLKFDLGNTVVKQLEILKHELRNHFSQILDFDVVSSSLPLLQLVCQKCNIDKFQMLDICNQCMLAEVRKFVFKVNTAININNANLNANLNASANASKASLNKSDIKNQNYLLKIEEGVKQKITKCSDAATTIANMIQKQWCSCRRNQCSMKLDPIYTHRTMANFIFSHLKLPNNQITQSSQQSSKKINFFSISFNPECSLLSLQNLVQRQSQQNKLKSSHKKQRKGMEENREVEQFLMNLKINDSERRDCLINSGWLQKMKEKTNAKLL